MRSAAGLLACLLLCSCAFPGSVKPVVKIGLSAPFEGLYRDLGYEALHATRLAVRERNAAGGLAGRYLVELVALNDFNDPQEAVLQAREMAADPGVLSVLGGWSAETARRSAPEYERLGLSFLAPEGDPAELGTEAAHFAVEELGASQIAILCSGNVGDEALVTALAAAVAMQGGEALVTRCHSERSEESRSEESRSEESRSEESRSEESRSEESVQAALSGQPDLLFVAADAPLVAEWIVAARKAGFVGPIVGGPGLGSPILVEIGGEAVEGIFYVSPFPLLQDDPTFKEGYQALSGGAPPSPAAVWAYAAAGRLLDALDAAARGRSGLDRATVGAALAGAPDGGLGAYMYAIRGGELFQQP